MGNGFGGYPFKRDALRRFSLPGDDFRAQLFNGGRIRGFRREQGGEGVAGEEGRLFHGARGHHGGIAARAGGGGDRGGFRRVGPIQPAGDILVAHHDFIDVVAVFEAGLTIDR